MASQDEGLDAVDAAWDLVLTSVRDLTDEQARGDSRLPGWTRGHLLTHCARSADGVRGCAESVARGELAVQYPDGADGRARDIEAGSGRPAAELVRDVTQAQAALMAAFRALPDDAWPTPAEALTGTRTMAENVTGRRRELLVHLVDLDVGVEPEDLPLDYRAADVTWLAEFRPDW